MSDREDTSQRARENRKRSKFHIWNSSSGALAQFAHPSWTLEWKPPLDIISWFSGMQTKWHLCHSLKIANGLIKTKVWCCILAALDFGCNVPKIFLQILKSTGLQVAAEFTLFCKWHPCLSQPRVHYLWQRSGWENSILHLVPEPVGERAQLQLLLYWLSNHAWQYL